ncbi:MAG: hypothetical protein Kow002_19610 [Anaerolineales bacterium]
MKLNWEPSLGTKIGVLTSALSILAILTLTGLSIARERQNFESELVAQANLLLSSSAFSIRDPLYFQERDELTQYVKIVDADPDVDLFIVYDPEGKVLADSTRLDETFIYSQTPDELGKILIELLAGRTYQRRDQEEDRIVVGQPVYIVDQKIGAIAIGLSTKKLDQKIAAITRQGLWLAAFVIALGTLLTMLLSKRIITPLSELAESAMKMADGDFSIRVQNRSQDEIGHLGNAFNQMAESIQQRDSSLRKMASQLETMVADRTAELQEKSDILEHLAMTDPLTKTYNRRHFFALAEQEIQNAGIMNLPLSVILMDADRFKGINDTFGHQTGDIVLEQLSLICQDVIRKNDIFARYGGEEFVVLMPNTSVELAYRVAERMRTSVEAANLLFNGQKLQLTISLGISTFDYRNNTESLNTLIAQADHALYRSKQQGRNKTTIWGQIK